MRLHEHAQRIADKYRNGQWIEDIKRELNIMCECCMCGGELQILGTLGNRDWYTCRDCGFEQSTLIDSQENDNE